MGGGGGGVEVKGGREEDGQRTAHHCQAAKVWTHFVMLTVTISAHADRLDTDSKTSPSDFHAPKIETARKQPHSRRRACPGARGAKMATDEEVLSPWRERNTAGDHLRHVSQTAPCNACREILSSLHILSAL